MGMIDKNGLKIDSEFYDFIVNEVIFGIGVDVDVFFKFFVVIVMEFVLKNCVFFEKCDVFQVKFDEWYCKNGVFFDMVVYEVYFCEIGYILVEGFEFQVVIENVDLEIVEVVGFQFVVFVFNVCYVLNVVNVCWGLFYDVFYGMDVILEIDGVEKGKGYNLVCGGKVIVWVCDFLDCLVLFVGESWSVV